MREGTSARSGPAFGVAMGGLHLSQGASLLVDTERLHQSTASIRCRNGTSKTVFEQGVFAGSREGSPDGGREGRSL
jgi:hypothetical protein